MNARAIAKSGWELVSEVEHDGRRYVVLAEEAPDLTPRERQIIARACLGQTNKVIAYELGLSDSTVRVLMGRVCAKLGVRTRREAIPAYLENRS